MATTPNDPNAASGNQEKKRDLEQEMLMREVDEAVRTDQAANAFRRFGIPGAIVLALGLGSFAAYLWWDANSEGVLEADSVALVQAIDELEAGNAAIANEELAPLVADASPGVAASAAMLRASIALENGEIADAVALYDRVANNADAPQGMRDAANLYAVTANFDALDPQEVIDRLGPLAVPENPWFGSAGELVAHAYLAQGRPQQAGPLLVQIAQDETVPDTLSSRARQLAGAQGFDAVEDVEETLEEMRREGPAGEDTPAQ